MSRKNWRAIAICDTLNNRFKILISYHGNLRLKCFPISCSGEIVSPEILGFRVPAENLSQNSGLNRIGASRHLFDELKRLCIFLTRRWTQRRTQSINRH
ncbi:hypothetical protein HanIR_Chr10g0481381 [Helianthus annuus]|nr:hypothetical protein HanIR_Chr10g0481381 [Helianthus annuus]